MSEFAEFPTSDENVSEKGDEDKNESKKYSSVYLIPLPMKDYVIAASIIIYALVHYNRQFYNEYSTLPFEMDTEKFKEGWFKYQYEYVPSVFTKHFTSLKYCIPLSFIFVLLSWTTKRNPVVMPLFTLAAAAYIFSPWAPLFFLTFFMIVFIGSFFHRFLPQLIVLCFFCLTMNYTAIVKLFSLFQLHHTTLSGMFGCIGYFACTLISCGHSIGSSKVNWSFRDYCKNNFMRAFIYCFYWPYFKCGPIMCHKDFEKRNAAASQNQIQWTKIISQTIRLSLYYVFLRFMSHFMYYFAFVDMERTSDEFLKTPYGHVAIAGYMGAIMYTMLYSLVYGIPGIFAQLDGIELYPWPRCISSVHSFRTMWRVWDIGLTSIVREHIYIPFGGSKNGLLRQILSTAAGCLFVAIYHGMTYHIKIYVGLNCTQAVIEILTVSLFNKYLKDYLTSRITPQNYRRLVTLAATSNFFLAGISVLCFVFYGPAGVSMSERLGAPFFGKESFYGFSGLFLVGYCMCTFNFAYEGYQLRKAMKEVKQD